MGLWKSTQGLKNIQLYIKYTVLQEFVQDYKGPREITLYLIR